MLVARSWASPTLRLPSGGSHTSAMGPAQSHKYGYSAGGRPGRGPGGRGGAEMAIGGDQGGSSISCCPKVCS
jgi:hypothetical protein